MVGWGKTRAGLNSFVSSHLRWSERRAAAQSLRRLHRVLEDGEAPVAIAIARIESDAGVLAVTTRRVLFVASGFERESDRAEVAWADGRQQATGGVLMLQLVDGGERRFGGVSPPGSAERIAALLQAGATGRPQPGRRFVREPVWRVTRPGIERLHASTAA